MKTRQEWGRWAEALVALDAAAAGQQVGVAEPKHLRARADKHVVAKRGVSLSRVFTRTAKRDSLIYRAVVANLGGLADNHAHSVVYKKALSYGSSGVYLNSRHMSCNLTYGSCAEIML